MSHATATPFTLAAIGSSLSRRRAASTSFAPSFANRCAVAAPMLRSSDAPRITTTLPSSLPMMSLLSCARPLLRPVALVAEVCVAACAKDQPQRSAQETVARRIGPRPVDELAALRDLPSLSAILVLVDITPGDEQVLV